MSVPTAPRPILSSRQGGRVQAKFRLPRPQFFCLLRYNSFTFLFIKVCFWLTQALWPQTVLALGCLHIPLKRRLIKLGALAGLDSSSRAFSPGSTCGGRGGESWESRACDSHSPGHAHSRLIHSLRHAWDTITARHWGAVSWLRSRLTGQKPGDSGASDSNSRAAGPAPPWWCSARDLTVHVMRTSQPPNPADPS